MRIEEIENIVQQMRESRVFSSLSLANKKFLSRHLLVRQAKKGEVLWTRNDPAEFCVFIAEGIVEIGYTKRGGEEFTIGLFGPGEVIGLSAILRRAGYPATAKVASKHCSIWKLYIRSMEAETEKVELDNLLSWQREVILIHEQVLRDKIHVQSAGSIEERLLALFDTLRIRFNRIDDSATKKIFIPFPVTKTQISKIVDCRVETVIRALNKWEKGGHLELSDKGITLIHFQKLINDLKA